MEEKPRRYCFHTRFYPPCPAPPPPPPPRSFLRSPLHKIKMLCFHLCAVLMYKGNEKRSVKSTKKRKHHANKHTNERTTVKERKREGTEPSLVLCCCRRERECMCVCVPSSPMCMVKYSTYNHLSLEHDLWHKNIYENGLSKTVA